MDAEKFILDKEGCVLLVVDIQERLAAVMKYREQVVKNNLRLIELARILNVPVLVSEQYPKGLGHTVDEIKEALPSCNPVEKLAFGCCGEPAFMDELRRLGKKRVILTGMETHICVLQTALGLINDGYAVHAVSDAMCSRTEENWKVGLGIMRDAGAVITCTETVLFQLLKVAGTEEFKVVSRMVK